MRENNIRSTLFHSEKWWVKALIPILVILFGWLTMMAIAATGDDEEKNDPVDTRPTVRVESLSAQDYQVVITSYGEVAPLERTGLAAQVSGEVVSWHESFVPGGLIERGEVLFTIEKDSYEAALQQAQANLAQAESLLIEEQARADVAKDEARRAPKAKVTDLYLRKPQLMSAKASVQSAQAQVKIAARDLANCEVRAPYDARQVRPYLLPTARLLINQQFCLTANQNRLRAVKLI